MSGMKQHCPIRLIAMMLAGVGVFGCAGPYRGVTGGVKFAPNGDKVAFLWHEGMMKAVVDGDVLSRDTYLVWCDVSRAHDLHSVQIDSSKGARATHYFRQWAFSPDSARVGAILPSSRQLVIVDLLSGQTRAVTEKGEIATSFGWLAGQEIGYVVRTAPNGQEVDRAFFRQKVGAPDNERVRVLTRKAPKNQSAEAEEYWSPHGSHVLFSDDATGELALLNMGSGVATTVSAGDMILREASWHPDGARVFCVIQEKGHPDRVSALVIDTNSGAIQDSSTFYGRDFPGVPPLLESSWTSDGQFVLANDAAKGAVLIHPHPWRVVWLGEIVRARLDGTKDVQPPWLFRLSVPGRVGLMPASMSDHPLYATNYFGSEVIMLMQAPSWWAFSPDGTRAAIAGNDKKLMLQDLGEWWLRETPASGSATDLRSEPAPAAR